LVHIGGGGTVADSATLSRAVPNANPGMISMNSPPLRRLEEQKNHQLIEDLAC
jgi:hypothetical protein